MLYFLFEYADDYPSGGVGDITGIYTTEVEAVFQAEKNTHGWINREILACSGRRVLYSKGTYTVNNKLIWSSYIEVTIDKL